jgi:uncharacterized membrane protein
MLRQLPGVPAKRQEETAMNGKHLPWLYEELNTLTAQGIVPPEVAERVRQHYGELPTGRSARPWLIVLFSIIGAVLIGGGIILLLAHNWEELSRPLRAVISFLPLIAAQGFAAWILWTGCTSTAWREGVGTFLALSIGACISLIAQTYNLPGNFGDFMLTWVLLGLPVAYLLGATLPVLLYLMGITVWTVSAMHDGSRSLGYWPLLAAALPFLWTRMRISRFHPPVVLFCWVLGLTLPFGLGDSLNGMLSGHERLWITAFSSLAGVFFLAGNRWWRETTSFWQRPLQNLGALGMTNLAVVFSFEDVWKELSKSVSPKPVIGPGGWNWFGWCVVAGLAAAAVALWADCLRRRDWTVLPMGTMPLVAFAGYGILQTGGSPMAAAMLFNVYLLALGLATLTAGVRKRRLGVVNGGMVVLAALILARFFDSDLGFVVRGVAFIVVGALFLATNLVLVKWKGAAAQ